MTSNDDIGIFKSWSRRRIYCVCVVVYIHACETGTHSEHTTPPSAVSGYYNHLVQILDIELLVSHCSALIALRNVEVRIAIAYTVLK